MSVCDPEAMEQRPAHQFGTKPSLGSISCKTRQWT
jgi:hypothetical protein